MRLIISIKQEVRQMWNNCRYHKSFVLQNFCQFQECSMPLCPKCIQIHLQEPVPHNIVPLQSMIADTKEYLQVCLEGLKTEINQLEGDLKPQNIHKYYMEMVEKYRLEAIEQINLYYKNLNEQLLIKIQNAYDQHLLGFKSQMLDKLKLFDSHLRDIGHQTTTIPTLIMTNFNNESMQAEELFRAYREKRENFKNFLPVLEPARDGNLAIASKTTFLEQQPTAVQRVETAEQANPKKRSRQIDRIASLEDKLLLLRSRVAL